ncbi:hypothetical protein NV226_01610 [Mycoplasma iguanae]|uniref:Uncharacterized protein n=1 Tax=Mycoplasma iguanae TaxID=292461 RepID=A0ABY5RCQ0_9MOLU|nr:hypothetical protein [Mycoplasma iguanae]UVD81985.1 hypothetical protein NV226_01610 [Mycoplasma iguanae]
MKIKNLLASNNLVSFLFIIIPNIFIWVFAGGDIQKNNTNFLTTLIIVLSVNISLAALIFIILILKWIKPDVIKTALPSLIIFPAIILTYDTNTWIRFAIIVTLIITFSIASIYLYEAFLKRNKKKETQKENINK